MSFIGNNNGLLDSKIFRKNVLAKANERLGVVVKTLSEGNGTQTNKTQGLLARLDSNYKSDVPATKYAMHLKAIAFESAKFLCSSYDYTNDLMFIDTEGEYLYQNIGSFLFPGEQIPMSNDTDVMVRNFYLSIIKAYFGGATKTNIENSLYQFTGIPVTLTENFELAKVNESLDAVVSQFVFNVNIDTTDPRIRDLNKLKLDTKFLLDLIKPAHTTYQTTFVYNEEFLTASLIKENATFDYYDYKYEDFRKKDASIYSFSIIEEIIQRHSVDNVDNIYQASPRLVKTRDQSYLKDSDPSIFHTGHGPLGKSDGQLAIDVTDITVLVNGTPTEVLEIYPLSGSFKLPFVPAQTDTIMVSYYYLRKYVGDFVTNNFDSLLNNTGNAGEYPYQTVLFPANYDVTAVIEPLLTSYRYKGYDLFNTSVLNDPLNLSYNESGTRNLLNDYHVFKSLGYDQGQYNTTLQEKTTLFPISLDKKDVWRRLPHQELQLNNNEYIMNNIEDRMFGEIHYESMHPFYSALEIDSIHNGGMSGIISTIFEDPTSLMTLSYSPIVEPTKTSLGRDYDCSFSTFSPLVSGYYPSSISVLNATGCVLLGAAHWEFGTGLSATGYVGGDYSSCHILANDLLTETANPIVENWETLWDRDPSENLYFSTLIPASGFGLTSSGYSQDNRGYLFHMMPDTYFPVSPLEAISLAPIHIDEVIREVYKKEWFLTNSSLTNDILGPTISSTKLSESEIVIVQHYGFDNSTPFTLNGSTGHHELFSINSDLITGWIQFLAPKKICNYNPLVNVVYNETSGLYFDLTDSYILNNQVICIKNNAFNAAIFSNENAIQEEIIKSDVTLIDLMNETDHLVSVFNENFILYSDIDISSVSRLVNYTVDPLGHEYNLAGYYILGNSLIHLDTGIQTASLSKGDVVFAEFITVEDSNNPANTLTVSGNSKILNYIEIRPV